MEKFWWEDGSPRWPARRDQHWPLNNTDAAIQSLAFNDSAITWLRGGTSPEVWRTTFDVCTNGTDWITLGAGTRITGGWQRTGLNYPTNAIIRARGFVCGANWFVETTQVPALPLQFINANGTPLMSNGWFNTRLTGTTGAGAVVERSPDLIGWTHGKPTSCRFARALSLTTVSAPVLCSG